MRVKLLAALVLAAILLTLAFTFRAPGGEEKPKGSWKVSIAYPPADSLPGGIALSSYSITMCLSFFSEGRVNETNLAVGSLGEVERGNVTIVIRVANETSIRVFTSNSTILVQGKGQDGLFAATDRLLLAIAGEYALDLDSSRNYLRVVHPSRGHQVGLPWLGGYTVSQVKGVPIYFESQVDLRRFVLGPFSP